MIRLIIFTVWMLFWAGICNGQGRSIFGAQRAQDTSYTPAWLKIPVYATPDTNKVLGIDENGKVTLRTKGAPLDTTSLSNRIDAKENSITAGTTSQYWRGDKSFQTLDKTAVGLSNVDNTSDANKPVSTAQQTALNLKVNTSSLSNGSIEKSRLKTTVLPYQSAVERLVELRSNTSPLTPTQWYKFDSAGCNIIASNKVDTLYDLSGNGNHMVQATSSKQATYTASGGMNNKPYGVFTSASLTNYTAATGTDIDSTWSMYYVLRLNLAATQFLLGGLFVQNSGLLTFYNNGAAADSIATKLHDWSIFEMHRKGREIEYYLNGMRLKRFANMTSYQLGGHFSMLGSNSGGFGMSANVHEFRVYAGTRHTQAQRTSVRNALFREYGVGNGTIQFIGHSWVEGSTPPGNPEKISTKTATRSGLAVINQGIGGTVLINDGLATNGTSRTDWLARSVTKNDYLVLLYMLNDARAPTAAWSATTYSPWRWKQEAATMLWRAKAKSDLPARNIQAVVESYTTYSGDYTQARHDSFATYELNMAAECGYRSLDLRTVLGTRVQTAGDGVHPTSLQADTIAEYIINAFNADYSPRTENTITATYHVPVVGAFPYVCTGTTCAMPLPSITNNNGATIEVTNQGSGNVTFSSYTGSQIWVAGAAAASYDLAPGKSALLTCRNNYWVVKLYD